MANVSDLPSDLRRLIPPILEAASFYWIQPEFDYLGGSPELCGYNCALCGGGGDTEETIEHAPGCIVPDAMALPRILTALAPAVKPLVWKRQSLHWWQAETPFGPYGVKQVDERDYRAHLIGGDIELQATLEAAQSAAWAHWSERIGGALKGIE